MLCEFDSHWVPIYYNNALEKSEQTLFINLINPILKRRKTFYAFDVLSVKIKNVGLTCNKKTNFHFLFQVYKRMKLFALIIKTENGF